MRDSKKSLSRSHKNLKISPKSDNTLSTGKMGYDVSCFETSPSCFLHGGEYITHFCEHCDYKPLCGLCLQEGSHKGHEVSNVEKANKKVERVLKETLVTLNAKDYFLKILTDYLETKQNEIDKEFQDYLRTIDECFEHIETCLEEKKINLLKFVENFYRKSAEQILEADKCAKEERNKTKEMMDILSDKGEKLEPANLCIYYYEKKEILQATKEEGNVIYEELKSMAPDLRWMINGDIFEDIKNQINSISIKSNNTKIELIVGKIETEKRKSVRKSKEKSFLKAEKIAKFSNNSGFWTPKNGSAHSNKALNKFFKEADHQKLMTFISSESKEKIHRPVDSTPNGVLLKKGKGKLKQEKNF